MKKEIIKELKEVLFEKKKIIPVGTSKKMYQRAMENFSREYFQKIIVPYLYSGNKGFEKDFIFMGGTALRLIYKTDRYSEDLDFSFHNYTEEKNIKLLSRIEEMKKEFNGMIEIKDKGAKTAVKKIFFNILGLSEVGLFPLESQKLAIKFEYDINPPEGTGNEIKKLDGKEIVIYNKSTLKTGKFTAAIFRGYSKGRDYFDVKEYLFNDLFKDINLNLKYFNSMLKQNNHNDGINGGELNNIKSINSEKEIFELLNKRLKDINKNEETKELIKIDLDKFVLGNTRYLSDLLITDSIYKLDDIILEKENNFDNFNDEYGDLSFLDNKQEETNGINKIEDKLKSLSRYSLEGKTKFIEFRDLEIFALNSASRKTFNVNSNINFLIKKNKIIIKLFKEKDDLIEFLDNYNKE